MSSLFLTVHWAPEMMQTITSHQAPQMLAWRFTQEAKAMLTERWESDCTVHASSIHNSALLSELQAFACGREKRLECGQTSVGQTGRTCTKQKVNLCLPTSVQVQPRGAIKKAALVCTQPCAGFRVSRTNPTRVPRPALRRKFTYSITPPSDLAEVNSQVWLIQPVHS